MTTRYRQWRAGGAPTVRIRHRRRCAGIALAAVLVLGACDRTATVATRRVTDEDTPGALADMVQSMMPRLERLSGLERTEVIRLREQDRTAVRGYVEQRLQQEMPPEQMAGIQAAYALLGLIPDTLDLRSLLLELYTEQVLGYYDPESRTLYVLGGADADALQPVVAHELVHALQDQHTNLDSLIAHERGNDRQTAAHAAMEGHAMVVMFAFLAELASGSEVDPAALPSPARDLAPALAEQTAAFPVFNRAPRIIRETLLFPYIAGSDFVHALWSHRTGGPPYPAPLDSLVPQSTQQVLQPLEHFIGRRTDPVELRFATADMDGVLYENTLGQLEIGILLVHHLGEPARAQANGWRGDRFLVVRSRDGDALAWTSVWHSTDAAAAFADAVRRLPRTGRSTTADLIQLGELPAVHVTDTPASGDPALRHRLAALRPTAS